MINCFDSDFIGSRAGYRANYKFFKFFLEFGIILFIIVF
jgi:hypothetical protein